MTDAATDAKDVGAAVTRDRLLGGRVTLLQPASGYRAAVDPVLLAAAVPARGRDRVVELGSGTGAAALCLLGRVPGVEVVGLEPDAESRALAAESARLTGVGDRLTLVPGGVDALPDGLLGGRGADHVMANPPHLDPTRHRAPADPHRAGAHMGPAAGAGGDLAGWIAAAERLLRPKGWLTLIHRADALDRLIALISRGFGGLEIIPIWPKAGADARRVIVRARKGGLGPARLSPGLVLHKAEGGFTAEARAILEDAAALEAQTGQRPTR